MMEAPVYLFYLLSEHDSFFCHVSSRVCAGGLKVNKDSFHPAQSLRTRAHLQRCLSGPPRSAALYSR